MSSAISVDGINSNPTIAGSTVGGGPGPIQTTEAILGGLRTGAPTPAEPTFTEALQGYATLMQMATNVTDAHGRGRDRLEGSALRGIQQAARGT